MVGVFVVEGSGWNTNKSKLDVEKKNAILLPTGYVFNPIPVQFLTFSLELVAGYRPNYFAES